MAEIEAVRGAHFKGMRGLGVDLHCRPPTFDLFILLQKVEAALDRWKAMREALNRGASDDLGVPLMRSFVQGHRPRQRAEALARR